MKPEDIKLISDFHDYYDHNFAFRTSKVKYTLNRNGKDGMHKYSQLQLIQSFGYPVPPHGTVHSVMSMFPHEHLIVYTDPFAHRSEGKHLSRGNLAYDAEPGLFCTALIPHFNHGEGYSRSYRQLWIGNVGYMLDYSSDDLWASNFGNVHIRLVDKLYIKRPPANYPLFAIDFIQDIAGKMWGIDFNTAPGIKGTPVEKLHKPREVAQLLADWYDKIHVQP